MPLVVYRGNPTAAKRPDMPARTIVLAAIKLDIRKRPARFHEWNRFAYNDQGEIGYREFAALRGDAKQRIGGRLRQRGGRAANPAEQMTKLPSDENRRRPSDIVAQFELF